MESMLATFRLFVQHGRPLESAQEERELRQQFEKFGRVTSFSTRRGEWRNSQVTFSNTEQAEALDKTKLNSPEHAARYLLYKAKSTCAGSRIAQ
jgi:hypothetical protein